MLLLLVACAHHDAADPAHPLSSPERAAIKLGLVRHTLVTPPDWLGQTKSVWVKTTKGECAEFAGGIHLKPGSTDYLHHDLCSDTRPNGDTVGENVSIEIVAPPPAPLPGSPEPYSENPREGGVAVTFAESLSVDRARPNRIPTVSWSSWGRRGPWFVTSATDDAVRFQSIVQAWFLPVWASRKCDAVSTQAIEGLSDRDKGGLGVENGRQTCMVEGKPLTDRLVHRDYTWDFWPQDERRPGTADCRFACPPYHSDNRPSPLYDDPKPEVAVLYRTESACEADSTPGLYQMPAATCDTVE